MVINSIFASAYVIEFSLRFYHYRFHCLRTFAQVLDFLLVLIAIVDTWVLYFVLEGTSIRSVSMLRVLRVIRLSRVIKFMTKQTELRLLIQSLTDIHRILIPMSIAMVCVLYFYALVMAAFYERGIDDRLYPAYSRWSGSEYWGSIPRSMFTLFQVATGDKWAEDIVRPLLRRYPLYAVIFVPFVLIMFFGLKAALVAKISDHVIQSGNVAERRMQAQERHTKQTVERLRLNFLRLKADPPAGASASDCLNYRELTAFVQEEDNRKLLSSLNVPVSDLGELFYILDSAQKEFAAIDQFFASILRLTGPAMGRHVTSVEKIAQSLAHKMALASSRIAILDELAKNINTRLSGIAELYGLKSGRVVDQDINVITAESSSEGCSFMRGSGSSLSLRSRRGRLARSNRFPFPSPQSPTFPN